MREEFEKWLMKYPLPAEFDGFDALDREQWTAALLAAFDAGAIAMREAILRATPGGNVMDPQAFCDTIRALDINA